MADLPAQTGRICVVSWVRDHGRSRGLAAALDADAHFMPWVRSGLSVAGSILGWARSARRTWCVVRALPPRSVVVVMCPPVFAVVVAMAAAGRHRAVVVDAHSGTFNDPRWRWSHPILRWALRHVALVLVTNMAVADGFLSPRTPFLVVHDPMHPATVDADPPPTWITTSPYVVFPTSGARDEPIAAVLAAARVLGGDPLVVMTGERSDKHGGPGAVGTGYLSGRDYRSVLHHAAAVLALTDREGTMQRAAYEALEVGLPIVCSDHEALRDALGDAATYCANEPGSIADAVAAAVTTEPSMAAERAADVHARLAQSLDAAVVAIRRLAEPAGASSAPEQPLVSIVIDNYNYARFLPRSIESALGQSHRPLEVIVVDDGSTDASLDVLAGYRDRVTIKTRPNGGQAAALNTGFDASHGSIVIFLDADDELYPTAAERVVAAMSADVGKVHFRLDTVDADGARLGFTNPTGRATLTSGDARRLVLDTGRYVTPVMSGNAYPRRVLDAIMPVPEEDFRISADGYLVALAALHGRIVAIDEPLGAYRMHGGNAWATSEGVDGARLRTLIRHDFARYRAVATTAGVQCRSADQLGRRDQAHLRSRLASLRLEPHLHPVPEDTRARLVVAGLRTAVSAAGMSARQRVSFLAWFPIVAFGPRRMAVAAVTLLHSPQLRYSRPNGRITPTERTFSP
jgi:hypothetical protein